MGDVADMMLEGVLCGGCGVYIGESVSFPRFCVDCASIHDVAPPNIYVRCPQCGKKVNRSGLKQHQEAKHNER